ncbi:uncharacterized protein LOC122295180 [Carya illinoinensis]|uniref:uncharacterized protein LOC122295180 n=1 Tax=Carya illinoinensis TaxID=32201 RepID=UPI001C72511E|nr:uncharacterized protein LOC122295180 [Carya illinoinensis]
MNVKVIDFERLKEEYESCPDYRDIFLTLQSGQSDITDGFRLEEGYLFRANKLCIPRTSVWDFIVWEVHAGGLARHFGRDKTIEEVEREFYWPSLKKDVAKIVSTCNTYQLAKQKRQNTGLYMPLPVPSCPCKTSDTSKVARLYFNEIVKLYGLPKTIVSDRDIH